MRRMSFILPALQGCASLRKPALIRGAPGASRGEDHTAVYLKCTGAPRTVATRRGAVALCALWLAGCGLVDALTLGDRPLPDAGFELPDEFPDAGAPMFPNTGINTT